MLTCPKPPQPSCHGRRLESRQISTSAGWISQEPASQEQMLERVEATRDAAGPVALSRDSQEAMLCCRMRSASSEQGMKPSDDRAPCW